MIRRDGPIGQAQIAKAIGQSLPAVMNTVRFPTNAGLVREIPSSGSAVGKPPKLLEFVKDSPTIASASTSAPPKPPVY